jgi:hypothetical protein
MSPGDTFDPKLGGLGITRSRSSLWQAVALLAAAVITVCIGTAAVDAKTYRSRAVTTEFQHEYPCPSTGKTSGACPGWIKDHIIALCAGGVDAVWNMQWQTIAEAKAKDKWECK